MSAEAPKLLERLLRGEHAPDDDADLVSESSLETSPTAATRALTNTTSWPREA